MLRQIGQLEFQLEELEAVSAVEETQTLAPVQRPALAKLNCRPLPKHLPREVNIHQPGHENCPNCGRRLRGPG